MCFFGGKPHVPDQVQIPKVAPIPVPPVEQQAPQIETGADQAAKTQQPRRKSIFQIDLTIPQTGGNTGGGSTGGGSGTGAAVR